MLRTVTRSGPGFGQSFLIRRLHRQRDLFRLALESGLLQLLLPFLLLFLLYRKRGDDAVAPLPIEEQGILLIDIFLFFSCRVGTGNIEATVLHEVVVSVTTARLAPPGELRIALSQCRCLVFFRCCLLRQIRAGLKILWRVIPPLRANARRLQQHATHEQ